MTIRRLPDDFLVREVLSPGVVAMDRGERSHAVYELTKVSLTTPEAASMLAAVLGVRAGQVAHAGLKDKHARTAQHVSVAGRLFGAVVPADVSGPGWSARLVGWADKDLSAAAIAANQFEIVVRDLTPATSSRMDERARALAADGEVVVMNYFGDQRFGSARHGGGFVAARLVRGDFEGALRLAIGTPARKDTGKRRTFSRMCAGHWGEWPALAADLPRCPERAAVEALARGKGLTEAYASLPHAMQVLHVEAYQSHLWNDTARRIAAEIDPSPLRTPDDFGELVFPRAMHVSGWRGVEVPMVSPTTALTGPWATAAAAALAADGIALADLRVPGLRRPVFGEAWRPLFVAAINFDMTDPVADELSRSRRGRRTLRFELPRGAYATVVLRALGQ